MDTTVPNNWVFFTFNNSLNKFSKWHSWISIAFLVHLFSLFRIKTSHHISEILEHGGGETQKNVVNPLTLKASMLILMFFLWISLSSVFLLIHLAFSLIQFPFIQVLQHDFSPHKFTLQIYLSLLFQYTHTTWAAPICPLKTIELYINFFFFLLII